LVKPIAVLAALVRAHDYSYSLPSQKRELLLRVARDFGCLRFVETGTYVGETTAFMAENGLRCTTIELDHSLAERARSRFQSGPHEIAVLEGDSTVLLPQVIAALDGPALFWLDAHFSSGVTAGAGSAPPLLTELTLILAHRQYRHCIAIDDARDLLGLNGYPNIRKVASSVSGRRADYTIRLVHDIVLITPASM
jgi:hypothetical protein